MTTRLPQAMLAAQQRATANLASGDWRAALAEFGAIITAYPNDRLASVGTTRALARAGLLAEAHLVLDEVTRRYEYSDTERRNVVTAVQAEAGPASPNVRATDVAAEMGLLVWRPVSHSGVYLTLLLVLSVIPLIAGIKQGSYLLVGFAALTGGALCYAYVWRHRVPVWRS